MDDIIFNKMLIWAKENNFNFNNKMDDEIWCAELIITRYIKIQFSLYSPFGKEWEANISMSDMNAPYGKKVIESKTVKFQNEEEYNNVLVAFSLITKNILSRKKKNQI